MLNNSSNFFLLTLLFFANSLQNAQIFYVSNSSAANYSTISEVNEAMKNGDIPSGSEILFKRNDIFIGEFKITRDSLLIDSWGEGEPPILDGAYKFVYGIVNGPVNKSEWQYFENIIIRNLEVKNYTEAGIRIVDVNNWKFENIISHDNGTKEWLTFNNCNFYESADKNSGEGIQITGKNISIKNCTVYNNGNHGIFVTTFNPLNYIENVTITENVIYNNHHSGIDLKNNGGPEYGIKNITISYNDIFDTFDNIGPNYIRETGIMLQGHSDSSSIEDVSIYYNLISNMRGIGINIIGATNFIKIHNNTVYGIKASSAVNIDDFQSTYSPNNIEIFNNIGHNESIYEPYGSCNFGNPVLSVKYASSISCDYNIWFNELSLNTTWSNNNNSYFGDNNLLVNPILDPNNRLRENSPAIGFGVSLGYEKDKANLFVEDPPEIGAYQYYNQENYSPRITLQKQKNTADDNRLVNSYPNPFYFNTKVGFKLKTDAKIYLAIYNTLGQLVDVLINGTISKGVYELNVITSDLSSGVYFCTLIVGNKIESKKMVKIRN